MGKRKSARKPPPKTKQSLSKVFPCVFCNHENTVSTKFDMENKRAYLNCSACAVSWQCAINGLTEPIDVYSEWIDACEMVQEKEVEQEEDKRPDYDSDDDDF